MSIMINIMPHPRYFSSVKQEEGHIEITEKQGGKVLRVVKIMGFFYNPIHCCYNDADAAQKTFRNMDHVQCEALRRYLAGEY